MHPGLRIGFIVAPRSLVPALTQARRLNDSHESALLQYALARFISEGHLARHVRRMSEVYTRRRAALLEMLIRFSSVFGNVVPSVAGLHVACLQETAKQASALLRRAEQGSARFAPLSRFSTRPGKAGAVLRIWRSFRRRHCRRHQVNRGLEERRLLNRDTAKHSLGFHAEKADFSRTLMTPLQAPHSMSRRSPIIRLLR
jgi:hypothetical protein